MSTQRGQDEQWSGVLERIVTILVGTLSLDSAGYYSLASAGENSAVGVEKAASCLISVSRSLPVDGLISDGGLSIPVSCHPHQTQTD